MTWLELDFFHTQNIFLPAKDLLMIYLLPNNSRGAKPGLLNHGLHDIILSPFLLHLPLVITGSRHLFT